MHNTYRAIRQLERFLFRGIPEHPEPVYPGEGYNNFEVRLTSKPQAHTTGIQETESKNEHFATVVYGEKSVDVIYPEQKEK